MTVTETAMHDEEFQNWQWSQDADAPPVICEMQSKRPVATLHACSDEKALVRAALIAAAPGMYATLKAVLEVLRMMAQEEKGQPAGLAAEDMIPAVEHALAGAGFMGEVWPALLVGE
jgi:hypothetical protein